jgi:hypothetical protein
MHHYAAFGLTIVVPPFESLIDGVATACHDAGRDAGPDIPSDAPVDASQDRADAGSDASIDGPPISDARPDVPSDVSVDVGGDLPGLVTCASNGRFVYQAPSGFEIRGIDINNNGELLWIEQSSSPDFIGRLRSSTRGTLGTINAFGNALDAPSLNDSGKTVWTENVSGDPRVVIDGTRITAPGQSDFNPKSRVPAKSCGSDRVDLEPTPR